MADHQFGLPRARLTSKILLPGPGLLDYPRKYLCLRLWASGLKLHLKEFLYTAETAQLRLALGTSSRGLRLSISGFSDGLSKFAAELGARIAAYSTDPFRTALADHFDSLKLSLSERLENSTRTAPHKQLAPAMNRVVYAGVFQLEDLLGNLRALDRAECLSLCRGLLSAGFVETLISGNLTQRDAERLESGLLEPLRAEGLLQVIPLMDLKSLRPVQFPRAHIALLESPLPNPDERNGLCAIEFQLAPDPHRRLLNRLLEKHLAAPFFQALRTEQQLGYVVYAQQSFSSEIARFRFVAQSNHKLPGELAEAIFAFVIEQRLAMAKLTQERFESLRQGVLAGLRQDFTSLAAQHVHFFGEIERHKYRFDRRAVSIAQLEALGKEDLVAHFQQMFFGCRGVLEMHLVPSTRLDENQRHVDSRGQRSPNEFEALPVRRLNCPEELKRQYSQYQGSNLTTGI